jgi:pyrroloquinoline quinone biosynthesis protein B
MFATTWRRALATGLLAAGCGTTPLATSATSATTDTPSDPYVLVVGTAQDGGLPQIGCNLSCCEVARADPSRRRLNSALLLVDPRSGKRWLFDAGPDLPEIVETTRGIPPNRTTGAGRPPLFDGIFVTHAHLGHVAGLLSLGREAYGARSQPVYVGARMSAFLSSNAPWSLAVDDGHLALERIKDERTVVLAEDLRVTPWRVPHRDEFSETFGFVIEGPSRSLLYLPDIDKWERWGRPLEEALAAVDVALIDGSFFADGEIPGRSMADIQHPFISETIARLAAAPRQPRAQVLFTHLNHTNPAADPDGAAAAAVRRAGHDVAADGQVIDL